MDNTTLLTCASFESCSERDDSGAFGTAIAFDGNDGITVDETFELQGDYTFAFWVKTSEAAQQEIVRVTDVSADNDVIGFTTNNGIPTFAHVASNGSVVSLTGPQLNGGAWHHVAMVLDGTQTTLYINGVAQPIGQAVAPHNGTDVQLTFGKAGATSDLNQFIGSLDEFLYIPEATGADGVQVLMNSTWPVIDIPEQFVTFSADPFANINVNGTALVSADAADGLFTIDQEVEAALALQNEQVVIPVVDLNSSALDTFLTFEDVPGATNFENIGTRNDYTCSGTECPTAGLRSLINRAAYFDGIDDGLTMLDGSLQSTTGDGDGATYAMWVKGERGTLFDSGTSPFIGLEADMSGMDGHRPMGRHNLC